MRVLQNYAGMTFLRLVDFYNNIPFDEGLQGTKFPTPKYETGKSVHMKNLLL